MTMQPNGGSTKPQVFCLRSGTSDGPPTVIEFEPKEDGTVEYRVLEHDADCKQLTIRQTSMSLEEARRQWQTLMRLGYKCVA
jgi:hypothetical protein